MSKSRSKDKQQNLESLLYNLPHVQHLPQGKLVVCIVDKQSSTGCFENRRLLVYNGKDHTVGYSNLFPKQIPIQSFQNLRFIKKSTHIMNASITRDKNNHKKIEIQCKNYFYRKIEQKKKEKWVFTFKNISGATEMLNQLFEAQKEMNPSQEVPETSKVTTPTPAPVSYQQNRPNTFVTPLNQPVNQSLHQSNSFLSPQQQHYELSRVPKQDQHIYSFGSKDGERKGSDTYLQMKNSISPKLIESRYKQEEETDYKRPNQSSRYNLGEESGRYNQYQEPGRMHSTPPKLDLSSLRNNSQGFSQGNTNYLNNSHKYQEDNIYPNSTHKEQSSIDHIKQMFPHSRYNNSSTNKYQSINYIPTLNKDSINPHSSSQHSFQRSSRNNSFSQPHYQHPHSHHTHSRDWNKEFYHSSNPISIISSFKHQSSLLVKQIIDSITQNTHRFSPISQQKLSTIYQQRNMTIILGISLREDTFSLQTRDNFTQLFNDNYYLSTHFSNTDSIQIPLLSLVEYKGITSLVKAKILASRVYEGQSLKKEVWRLESLTGVRREELGKFKYRAVSYNEDTVVYIDIIDKLFPHNNEAVSPLLMKLFMGDRFDKVKSRVKEDILVFKSKQLDALVRKLQSTEEIILSVQDLHNLLDRYGIDYKSLSSIYFRTELQFIQDLIATEAAAEQARNMISYHLQRRIREINSSNKGSGRGSRSQDDFVQLTIQLIDNLCSHTKNSEELWGVIIKDIKKKWGIGIADKMDINWGYFIGALIYKLNIRANINLLDKNKRFGKEKKCINPEFIRSFEVRSTSTTVSLSEIDQITRMIYSPEEISQNSVKYLLENKQILSHLQPSPYFPSLLLLLSQFMPINPNSLLFPQYFPFQPPSVSSVSLQTLKINTLLSSKNQQKAIQIFQTLCQIISFWGGEFHPSLSNLYGIFAQYYFKNRHFKDAISLYKSSIVNTAKLVGNELCLAGKYSRLGEILDECEKGNEALSNYMKARDIFMMKLGNNSLEVGELEYKIGLKHFEDSNPRDSLQHMKKALKILLPNPNTSQDTLLHIFEILNGIYQNLSEWDLLKQNSIHCFETLFDTESISKYQQVLRISILPFLVELDRGRREYLRQVLKSIKFQCSKQEYRRYLNNQVSPQNVLEEFVNVLRRIEEIGQELKQIEEQRRQGRQSKGRYDIDDRDRYPSPSRSMSKSKSKGRTRGESVDVVRDVSILEGIVGIAEIKYVLEKIQQYST